MMTGPRALYLCYFGLREPLVQTQVLPYLRELVAGGVSMSLLTFEPEPKKRWTKEAIEDWRERLRRDGIEWYMLKYHKRPSLLATLFDVIRGVFLAVSISRRERIELFHGRSHVGAAIGALAKWITGARLLFDIRGFLADEYVDSGNWRAGGFLFTLTKKAERWLYRASDGFVVLTESAREALFPNGTGAKPVEIIPCCAGAERFASALRIDRETARAELGLAGRTVFVYIGALGGYYLTRETADLLATARRRDPSTYALVLTATANAMAKELEQRGFTKDDFRVTQIDPGEIPRYLRAADVALSLIRTSFARRSASPTKLAEYFAAGLPVIVTAGIGDVDAHVAECRGGVLLRSFDDAAYNEALDAIEELRHDPGLAVRCQTEARLRYDLSDVGGKRYRRLYEAILRS
ncbi:MAG TPA: glycosyltransferase [Thermoanaerobaculia bacterium]|jgi:glycosyltransferase involved in cell wall biosynthesis|nr:glycosyltransferase [Thermoanaerobaculia bacterium]